MTKKILIRISLDMKMRPIQHSILWVSLWVILSSFWKDVTSQGRSPPLYSIQVSSSVSVQEGLCVTIPCNFTADSRNIFTNSFGFWKRAPINQDYIVATNDKSSVVRKTNFHLTGNPDSGDCTLTIADARKEDEGTYFFRFEEKKDTTVKYSYTREITTIFVTDLTENPIVSDLGTVIAGIKKTVTCAPPGNCSATSLVFQWKKSNVAGIWKNSSTVTFTPSLNDHQETITCEMTNSRRTTTQKNILLHVYPPNITEDMNDPPNITITEDTKGCISGTMHYTIIIGMVIGNIAAFILINVGSYFFLKRRMEKRQLGKESPDPGAHGEESTYQDLKGQKTDIYFNLKTQQQ